jgi:hypothetical protein
MWDVDDQEEQNGLEFGCDPVEVVRRIESFTHDFLASLAERCVQDIEMVRLVEGKLVHNWGRDKIDRSFDRGPSFECRPQEQQRIATTISLA